MTTATATDVQNNFGKFLKMAQAGEEIVIFKNGSEVARLVSGEKKATFLSDGLVGILSSKMSDEDIRKERMMPYEDIG